VVNRVSNARILIIDEVSMLSAQTLSMVDAVCREIRHRSEPFGGLQVVLVGDFFQLPPVSRRDEEQNIAGLFESDESQTQFAFSSPAWKALNPFVCYLSEQHRQEDASFLEFLSAVRSGDVNESHLKLLRTRYAKHSKDGVTELYSHNLDVNRINDTELGKLTSDEKVFEMESSGAEKIVAALKRGCLSPETLALKVGARVMFTKNDIERKFVNGTLATVVGFEKGSDFPIVETRGGRSLVAKPEEWHVEDGGRVLARITQIPLRLAWAITVHKSQGMSLDAAHMDLSDTFEYGQGYVALSRVRTLAGLSLAGLNKRALEIHPEISARDESFRELSRLVKGTFLKMPPNELEEMHVNFIRACGGSKLPTGKAFRKPEKISTYDKTRELLLKKLSPEEVAKERKVSEETILSHLEKLCAEKKIVPSRDLAHLKICNSKTMAKVRVAIQEIGGEFLKPIFEHLGGEVPYETIRLARILLSDEK
jgi:hypothetical protein